jgi:hypothetical protein
MLQQRLNGLAMCCIEKDILENIDFDVVLRPCLAQLQLLILPDSTSDSPVK